MTNLPASKSNLLAAKRSRDLAQSGCSLMEKKRLILSQELVSRTERTKALQKQAEAVFATAYSALREANIRLGQCQRWAEAVDVDTGLSLRYRSVMGVALPLLTASKDPLLPLPYGFTGSDSALDEARLHFIQAKALIRELAETESSVYRLAHAAGKARKRAAALSRVAIPRFDSLIRQMEEALAQREQEKFIQQKIAKTGQKTLFFKL